MWTLFPHLLMCKIWTRRGESEGPCRTAVLAHLHKMHRPKRMHWHCHRHACKDTLRFPPSAPQTSLIFFSSIIPTLSSLPFFPFALLLVFSTFLSLLIQAWSCFCKSFSKMFLQFVLQKCLRNMFQHFSARSGYIATRSAPEKRWRKRWKKCALNILLFSSA